MKVTRDEFEWNALSRVTCAMATTFIVAARSHAARKGAVTTWR